MQFDGRHQREIKSISRNFSEDFLLLLLFLLPQSQVPSSRVSRQPRVRPPTSILESGCCFLSPFSPSPLSHSLVPLSPSIQLISSQGIMEDPAAMVLRSRSRMVQSRAFRSTRLGKKVGFAFLPWPFCAIADTFRVQLSSVSPTLNLRPGTVVFVNLKVSKRASTEESMKQRNTPSS